MTIKQILVLLAIDAAAITGFYLALGPLVATVMAIVFVSAFFMY